MNKTKNKPVISRYKTKRKDVERLRGALTIANNPKIVEFISTPFRFQASFIRNAFLKAYLSADERDLLYALGWVRTTNGKVVKDWRGGENTFLKAYPNVSKRIDREIEARLAFLKAYGYKYKFAIVKEKEKGDAK